jgi:hypothetical protein
MFLLILMDLHLPWCSVSAGTPVGSIPSEPDPERDKQYAGPLREKKLNWLGFAAAGWRFVFLDARASGILRRS